MAKFKFATLNEFLGLCPPSDMFQVSKFPNFNKTVVTYIF